MKIAITGVCGYIGSHLAYSLYQDGHKIIGFDNNLNQNNLDFIDKLHFWDINTPYTNKQSFDCVVHLASATMVEESVKKPWLFYNTNIFGTKNVIETLPTDHFVFSSSGSAFNPQSSPYAASKKAAEEIVAEHCTNFTNLRFFNVSGNAGFSKFENNYYHLIRRAAATANGIFPNIEVYGNDYDTRDGTCIRNYTHITDIVNGIKKCVYSTPANNNFECLGNSKGYTVLEVIKTMQKVSCKDFPIIYKPKRQGDIDISTVPKESKFFKETKTLEDQCIDALHYERPL